MAIITDADLPKIYTEDDIDGNSVGNWFYFNGQTDFSEATQIGTDKIVTELRKLGKKVFKEDPGDNVFKFFTATEADLLDTQPIIEIAVDYAVAFILRQNWLASGGNIESAIYLEMKERELAAEDKLALIPFGFDSDGSGVLENEERHNTNVGITKMSR